MEKRNLLVFVSDTFRPDFLPIYGGEAIDTPNIDELAARGCVFTNAVAASTVCVPSRTSMFTGRFVSDHDEWTNFVPSRAGLEFLPERLAEDGYDTAGFGIIDVLPAPGEDRSLGFATSVPLSVKSDDSNPYFTYLKSRHPEVTSAYDNGSDFTFAYDEEDFYDYWVASEANAYFENYVKEDGEKKPFFAYVSFFGPHGPHLSPKETKGCVREDKVPPTLARKEPMPLTPTYRATFFRKWLPADLHRDRVAFLEKMVEVDRQIGRVREKLVELGLWENTTVILTADHGCTDNDFDLLSKGPYPYTSQLFVPMVVSNHPSVKAGSRSDALVGNIDLGATLLDIAGDRRPFGVSRSLLTIGESERDFFFSEFCDAAKTVFDKRYTFTYYPFTGERELYDRVADPDNQHNLSGKPEYAERELRMMGKAIDFLAIAKGVRIEAYDLFPERQNVIRAMDPGFPDNFAIAYPIDEAGKRELEKRGLDSHYNDFCEGRPLATE